MKKRKKKENQPLLNKISKCQDEYSNVPMEYFNKLEDLIKLDEKNRLEKINKLNRNIELLHEIRNLKKNDLLKSNE